MENTSIVAWEETRPGMTKADMLYVIEKEIREIKENIASGFLRLGMIFKMSKEKEIYKIEHDTFPSYVAQFGFSYSSVRSWIHIYELYVLKLKRTQDELQAATWGQLQVINPVVESNPEEWIGKAIALSRGDLINEVRKAQGKPEMEPAKATPDPPSIKSYEEYVATSPCCVCSSTPIEKAHFPRVKNFAEKPWYYIPLCHDCHINNLHQYGITHFLVLNRNKIFQFFYNAIEALGGKNE